jgi:hypothetical protein
MDELLAGALGFSWDRAAVTTQVGVHTPERAVWRYQRSLPEFVRDAAALEGNPFTFPEVQTLMDGITVGGRKLSDERQVANLAEAARELAARRLRPTSSVAVSSRFPMSSAPGNVSAATGLERTSTKSPCPRSAQQSRAWKIRSSAGPSSANGWLTSTRGPQWFSRS